MMARQIARLSFVMLLAALLLPPVLQAQEAEMKRAALVIVLPDEAPITACVSFPEAEISGMELLERSKIPLVVNNSSNGGAVCSLAGVGCDAGNCFCECTGADCTYWSYWQQQPDGWTYAQIGASVTPVQDGAVQGWVWGPGAPNQAPAPPPLRFADICTAGATASASSTAAAEPIGSGRNYLIFGVLIVGLAGISFAIQRRRHGD